MTHKQTLHRVFSIDPRSLAFFRVGLGLLVVLDFAKRALTLEEHYTDLGVLPAHLLPQIMPDPLIFRVFTLSGSATVQALLFAVAIAAGAALALGYRTRLAALICLLFVVSIQVRNPLVCHTGDKYLTVLLLWAQCLPLGARLSLDLKAGRVEPKTGAVFSLASVALLLQLGLFYVSAGVLKHGHEVWRTGDALHVFMAIDTYVRPSGLWLAGWPGLARGLSYGTLILEFFGGLLLFSPWQTHKVRAVLIVLFAGFHLGIMTVVYIGLFEVTCIVALVVLVPGVFWDAVARRAPVQRRPGLLAALTGVEPHSAFSWGGWRELPVAVCLAVMVISNPLSYWGQTLPLPPGLDQAAHYLQLNQKWAIFTAIDKHRKGWFVVAGRTQAGQNIDLATGGPIGDILAEPTHKSAYPNHNARRYWHLISQPSYKPLRPYLGQVLCRRWAQKHGERLGRVGVFLISPADDGVSKPKPTKLLQHACLEDR